MVARRRLKRPARRTAHLSPHRARVSLAEAAGIERITSKVDRDVENMRDELSRQDRDEHDHIHDNDQDHDQDQDNDEGDNETEVEGDAHIGEKVAGD